MDARDFGVTTDPWRAAEEDVAPYRDLSAAERYACFVDLVGFMERIWNQAAPEDRRRWEKAQEELDDPGPWWTRVPRR